jgi:spore germination cell wall hydrolase CwlJ-like protein
MLKKTSDALRRADYALAGAFLLTLATAGAAMALNPHTDQAQKLRSSVVQVADIAPAMPASTPVAPLPVLVNAPSPRDLALAKVLNEQSCLAEAMYYEARGEGVEGEEAIAEVIFNRMHAAGYPRSICGVVYEGAELTHGCQFSFTCNGEMDRPKSFGPWLRARVLAARILAGYVQLGNSTGGATSFHASEVEPDWADQMDRTVQIGNHLFYRPLGRSQAS